jgi:hypothetical protein
LPFRFFFSRLYLFGSPSLVFFKTSSGLPWKFHCLEKICLCSILAAPGDFSSDSSPTHRFDFFHALLNEKLLGFDLTAFAMVGLTSQAEADLVAFEEQARGWSLVRECHMLSGEIDFLLKCVAPDLTSFQDFIIRDLTAAANVGSVKTALAIRRSKWAPGVPIE